MPTLRAVTPDVLAKVNTQLLADARVAAGNNTLSQSEQSAMPSGVLKDAAVAARSNGARVTVDAMVAAASNTIATLLGQVNTTGPSSVSKREVKALAQLDADAGSRVARAYELITGKHIDLPASAAPVPTPVPVPVSTGTPLSVANLRINTAHTYNGSMSTVGNTLELKALIQTPASVDLDVNGQAVHAVLPGGKPSLGGVGGAADERDVIEALRAALAPHIDVQVASYHLGKAVVALYAAGTAPPLAQPTYLVLADIQSAFPRSQFKATGPMAFKCNDGSMAVGDSITLRLDDKLYQASARTSSATVVALLRDIKGQMEADGRAVVLKAYANGMTSLRVTG